MNAQLKTVEVGPFDGEDQPSRREWFLVTSDAASFKDELFPSLEVAQAQMTMNVYLCPHTHEKHPFRVVRLVEGIQP